MPIRVLSRRVIEQLLDPQELLPELAEGFKALSSGQMHIPPRGQIVASNGVVLVMPAAMPGMPICSKLVSIFHENEKLKVPSHHAIITLLDWSTGAPLAILDGEYITGLRTAAASILSIKSLARPESKTVALIGGGVQSQFHLRMLGTLDGLERIRLASRNRVRTESLAAMDARVHIADSVNEAVADADVVCLCTSSPDPVIQSNWLKPGVHITSIGYRPPHGELPRDLIEKSRLFVEAQTAFSAPPVGSAELQGLSADFGTELGEVLLKLKPGRTSEHETTIYKSIGLAMEDLVAANLVYQRALEQDAGIVIDL